MGGLFTGVTAGAQFTSGVNLVEVYATVTDRDGRPVPNLTAADFRLDEDGVPQEISVFAAGEFPLAVAVGIDRSFSMRARLPDAVSATRSFISSLRPDDQVMVLAIGSETATVVPLTRDHVSATRALDRIEVWGTTALYDALVAGIEAMQPASGRRALIVMSDGTDRYSGMTAAEMLERARRGNVLIYPIALSARRPEVFAELAAVSGARSFLVNDRSKLQPTLATIADELRFQYLLGYTPSRGPSDAPEWRRIEVRVDRLSLRVRARDGYVARRR
jgi:Ca-activated chloride channel family protein